MDPANEQGTPPDNSQATVTEVAVPDAPVDAAPTGPFDLWMYGVPVFVIAIIVWMVVRPKKKGPAAELEDRTLPAGADRIEVEQAAKEPAGLASRLAQRLSASRNALKGRFDQLFGGSIDDDMLEELEEVLLVSDVGVTTTERILTPVREAMRNGNVDPASLRHVMKTTMSEMLMEVDAPMASPDDHKPLVLLVVGVNGSGKTTSIGKIAARYVRDGKSVILGAADTYRAAAADQLAVWAERAGATLVRHKEGADPGAVVYEALEKGIHTGADVVIIDTAGRLQTVRPLMEQLSKINRVIRKLVPDGPHETLLVVDGTMGQNALSQARSFHEATPLTGVVVTKLDGTAKGGMVLAISSDMAKPIKFIGIGEQIDDLRPFDPQAFLDALV